MILKDLRSVYEENIFKTLFFPLWSTASGFAPLGKLAHRGTDTLFLISEWLGGVLALRVQLPVGSSWHTHFPLGGTGV